MRYLRPEDYYFSVEASVLIPALLLSPQQVPARVWKISSALILAAVLPSSRKSQRGCFLGSPQPLLVVDLHREDEQRRWLEMKRVFGAKKNKEPPPTIEDASDRINKRGETVDEKIKKLDAELARYKEQIKKTRPGPAQEAVKSRAMRVLKQKRMYEGQRDMIYNQTFNLDQVSFAAEGLKDAQQTMSALKSANKELKGMMKSVNISDIDSMQDEMMDLMDVSTEIQESLGRSYSVPDDIDEEELMGELDALEADMGAETEADAVPSYLQPDKEPDLEAELNLPAAPTGHGAAPAGRQNVQGEDFGLPAVPQASIRG